MSEDTTKAADRTGAPAGARATGGGASEGTLKTLGELEQHFERIKKLHAATAEREAELEWLSAQVESRTREVDARAADLDTKVKLIDADRAAIDKEKSQIADARGSLEAAQKELAEQRGVLDRERQTAAETGAKIESQRAELARREEAVAAEEGRLRERQGSLTAENEKLRAAQSTLASDRVTLEKLLAESGTRDESLSARERSLEERTRVNAALEERLASEQAQFAQARAKLDEQSAAASQERQRLDAEQRDLAATQQRLASMMKAVQARAGELDKREQTLAAREKQHQEGTAAAAVEAERAADEQVRTLEAALAERASLIVSRDGEIAQLRSEAERLGAEVAKAQQMTAKAQADAKKALADAAAKAATTKAEPVAPSAETQAELEKGRRAIELLAEKLRAAQKESEQLRKRIEEKGSRPAPAAEPKSASVAHNAIRRRRLQKYKSLLQAQARKIMSAQAALTKRQAEADQILAHRSKLAQAAEHIRVREKRINAQRAKSVGAGIMFYFAATATALAAISWLAAIKLAPATFVASASVGADARGRKESNADLEGWQQYHAELVSDPALISQTAERVARRGISDLATPAALQAYLKANLSVESPRDGQVVLHLKGASAERTATLLDTYVTTMSAAANLSRTQRPDGLVTEIVQAVVTPDQPLTHKRMEYAGAFFGGAMLISLSLGGIGWRRVAGSRMGSDDAEAVESFLDEKNWPRTPQA